MMGECALTLVFSCGAAGLERYRRAGALRGSVSRDTLSGGRAPAAAYDAARFGT